MIAILLETERDQLVTELERRAAAIDGRGKPAIGRRDRWNAYVGELIAALRRPGGGEQAPSAATGVEPTLERQERELLRQLAIEQIAQHPTQTSAEDKLIVSEWASGSDRRLLVDENQRLQRRLELLYKLTMLAQNVDRDALLSAVAQLSIPELADWSAVDVPDEEAARSIYVAHRDPGKAAIAARLQRFAPWRGRAEWHQLLAGHSLLFAEVTDEMLRANAEAEEHYELVRQLGFRSIIAVPLRLPNDTIAVMTFTVTVESGRRYGPDDLALAEELTRRAGFIIEKAQLHAEVKASDARMRTALAMARTAVFEQDRELRYRWAYNLPQGVDIIGKRHADIFPRELADELTAVKQRVLDTGEPMRGELRGTGNSAASARMVAIDPVRDDSGAIVGIIGASTDITEGKRLQEELVQAVTFREQLMGILGHDLRNPLSTITMANRLLLMRQDLAPEARDRVLLIRRAADRMREMIDTLLDFSRARFLGKLPISRAPADLAEIARGVVDELRLAWPDHEVELDMHGDAHGQWDPGRMAQVLSNLLGNALTYGDPDEPVQVSVDGTGDEMVLRVKNQGPPIRAELLPVLFEPFRTGAPESRSQHGLGLGLYIVQQIVLAHQGTVDVASTAHEGTTFTVRLPRALTSATVQDTVSPAVH
jgi:signal transduction histidine kinase